MENKPMTVVNKFIQIDIQDKPHSPDSRLITVNLNHIVHIEKICGYDADFLFPYCVSFSNGDRFRIDEEIFKKLVS